VVEVPGGGCFAREMDPCVLGDVNILYLLVARKEAVMQDFCVEE
jgi:hypothetical protein